MLLDQLPLLAVKTAAAPKSTAAICCCWEGCHCCNTYATC